ncbi:MAG: hypothetical protein IKO12_04430 [Bacteroidaceae bacterium]|nr:hypothetical protein [Bacteroidaceae bacterium]
MLILVATGTGSRAKPPAKVGSFGESALIFSAFLRKTANGAYYCAAAVFKGNIGMLHLAETSLAV